MAKIFLALGLILVALMGFQNCAQPAVGGNSNIQASLGDNGTETGNVENELRIANAIGQIVCTRISSCHPQISEESCLQQAFGLTGIPARLGSSSGSATNLNQLHALEIQGLAAGDERNFLLCGAQLDSLACADPNMQNLNIPLDAVNFLNLLPASGPCVQLFQ